MKTEQGSIRVEDIDISKVHILNPRSRNKRLQQELIENIRTIGLKRPITVSRRRVPLGAFEYDLVCGQGRLEACLTLGQHTIPALIVQATEEDCLIMGLVENVARRNYRPIDMMREIGQLRSRGHDDQDIARKIGVALSWVSAVGSLLDKGEERLLAAVDAGIIPISTAAEIARSSSNEIQQLLAGAYEQGLKGRRLIVLRRILEHRNRKSKGLREKPSHSTDARTKPAVANLRKIFEREAERQRLIIKKANYASDRLLFSVHALKTLHENGEFVQMLREQRLDGLPKLLASRMRSGESHE